MIWPSDLEEFNKTTQGEFSGVGIQIQLDEEGSLKVASPLEDSPAYKAGIAAGDIILRLNGETVDNLEDFYRKLWNGAPGAEFKLTILHGVNERDVVVRSMDRKEYLRHKPSV